MADMTNVESAWLRAISRFERWKVEFDKQFYAPAAETMLGMITKQLEQLPPEVKQISRQMNPREWQDLDRMTAETRKKRSKEVRYG